MWNLGREKHQEFKAQMYKQIVDITEDIEHLKNNTQNVDGFQGMKIKDKFYKSTDPKNATLVMADMLRDKKLLTKFKGKSK